MRESLLEALITGKCLLGLFTIILPDPFSRKKHQFYDKRTLLKTVYYFSDGIHL